MRLFAFVLALGFGQLAMAQTAYDPAIAYTTPEKSGEALYVANADGTRAVRLVSIKGGFRGIDLAPSGRQIAYADAAGLKLLSFTATNSGVFPGSTQLLVATPPNGFASLPDFSPDGSAVLYEYVSQTDTKSFRAMRLADGAILFSHPCRMCEIGRWLDPDLGVAIAYLEWAPGTPNNSRQAVMAVQDVDGSFTPLVLADTATQAFTDITGIDAARTRQSALLSVYYPTGARLLEVDLATSALTDRGAGEKGHFTAGDLRIVCQSPHVAGGDYLQSIEVGSGLVTRISKKGNWGRLDARP